MHVILTSRGLHSSSRALAEPKQLANHKSYKSLKYFFLLGFDLDTNTKRLFMTHNSFYYFYFWGLPLKFKQERLFSTMKKKKLGLKNIKKNIFTKKDIEFVSWLTAVLIWFYFTLNLPSKPILP